MRVPAVVSPAKLVFGTLKELPHALFTFRGHENSTSDMVPSPGFRFHAGVHGAGSSCCVRALPGSPIARPGAGVL
nr:uncharacterized protein LOC126539614 isoform X2 [Dermacentor andersoni]